MHLQPTMLVRVFVQWHFVMVMASGWRQVGLTTASKCSMLNVVENMEQSLKKWQADIGAAFPVKNENYDQQKDEQRKLTLSRNGNPQREKQHAGFLNPDFKPKGGWWDKPKAPQPIKD